MIPDFSSTVNSDNALTAFFISVSIGHKSPFRMAGNAKAIPKRYMASLALYPEIQAKSIGTFSFIQTLDCKIKYGIGYWIYGYFDSDSVRKGWMNSASDVCKNRRTGFWLL